MKINTKLKFAPFYLISYLPLSVLHAFSDIGFVLLFYVIKYRRRVVSENLSNSFPEKTKEERLKIEKDFYQYFCDLMIGTIKALTMSRADVKERFSIKNPELIQKYFKQKKSILMYTAHQGIWEWVTLMPLFLPYQMTSFYQPLSNGYFEELMKIIRERFGMICVPSNKGYRSILEFEKKNILTMNCVVGDQSPRSNSTKHWLNFLNQDTAFLIGGDRIAKKSNQVVVFPAFKRLKRGYFEVEFKLITEDPKSVKGYGIVDKYAAILEETIQESPSLWLWSHRKWKLKREKEVSADFGA